MLQTTLESPEAFLCSLANPSILTIPSATLEYEHEVSYVPAPQQQHNKLKIIKKVVSLLIYNYKIEYQSLTHPQLHQKYLCLVYHILETLQ